MDKGFLDPGLVAFLEQFIADQLVHANLKNSIWGKWMLW